MSYLASKQLFDRCRCDPNATFRARVFSYSHAPGEPTKRRYLAKILATVGGETHTVHLLAHRDFARWQAAQNWADRWVRKDPLHPDQE